RRDGDRVYALVAGTPGESPAPPLRLGLGDGCTPLTPLLGHAHAASGLLHVAAAALALHHQFVPPVAGGAAAPLLPAASPHAAEISVASFGGDTGRVRLAQEPGAPGRALILSSPPRIYVYSGQTLPEALRALRADHQTDEGPARIVVVARNEEERRARGERA